MRPPVRNWVSFQSKPFQVQVSCHGGPIIRNEGWPWVIRSTRKTYPVSTARGSENTTYSYRNMQYRETETANQYKCGFLKSNRTIRVRCDNITIKDIAFFIPSKADEKVGIFPWCLFVVRLNVWLYVGVCRINSSLQLSHVCAF